ncbi:MAG: leucyl/phenylalanyl-tRNA--protein transferase [Marinirhabdus sp.]|nr:leucyl/phenylalanyl-tRNA--protein transferase [Marinirhabdus sp.]
MNILTPALIFPPLESASEDGLLAVGGDLSAERLLLAYRSGIFPWYEEGQPILWWSPDPRMVLCMEDFKLSKSLQKTIRKEKFRVTLNQNFSDVIKNCAQVKRIGQHGTWITDAMISAYCKLHELGHAQSFEVWQDSQLVGGGYGVHLKANRVFCGESMFTKRSDASKVGFAHLVSKLSEAGYKGVDCQVYTKHLAQFGAKEMPRNQFLKWLKP